MPPPDTRPLDAEDKERLAALFHQAVSELRNEYTDEDALMEAVVSHVVGDIDRLREMGDTWATRWNDRVAEMALTRLAERQIQNRRPTGR